MGSLARKLARAAQRVGGPSLRVVTAPKREPADGGGDVGVSFRDALYALGDASAREGDVKVAVALGPHAFRQLLSELSTQAGPPPDGTDCVQIPVTGGMVLVQRVRPT